MVWALDLDDFKNRYHFPSHQLSTCPRCGDGAHPLMHAMTAVLGPKKGAYAPTAAAERAGPPAVAEPIAVTEPPVEPVEDLDYDSLNNGFGQTGGSLDTKVVTEDGYKVGAGG